MYYKRYKKCSALLSVVAFLLSRSKVGELVCGLREEFIFLSVSVVANTDAWTPHLDQELRGPRLTRGVAGIWDDVQSDLGPRFLERMSSRRLWGQVITGLPGTSDIFV
jgi:hypothetical protein